MLAALILTAKHGGGPATRKLFGRAFDVRRIQDKRWLLLSVLIMPVVTLLSWLLMWYFDYPLPTPYIALAAIPTMVLVYFIGAIGEELGWMGYLVDPLQKRMNAISAALIIGFAWQAWHVVPFYAMGRSIGWISAQFLAGILMRIIIVWLYNKASESVLIAIVFHTSINVSFSLFPNQGSHYDPVVTALVLTIVAVVLGVVIKFTPSISSPAGVSFIAKSPQKEG